MLFYYNLCVKDSNLNCLQLNGTSDSNTDKEINDVTALAESIQPKGNTLSSTSVRLFNKIKFINK